MANELCLPFGKYKGQHVESVPAGYLLWCLEQDWISRYSRLHQYILKNKKDLEKDAIYEEQDNEDMYDDMPGNPNYQGWKD